MSSGDIDNHLIGEDRWLQALREHPWLRDLRKPIGQSHAYDIPYLGGISTNMGTIYYDMHMPLVLRLSTGPCNITDFWWRHELFEAMLVLRLGFKYADAHEYANRAEVYGVREMGHNWIEYNRAIDKHVKPIEHESVLTVPPDLALYPYQDDPKTLAAIMRSMR